MPNAAKVVVPDGAPPPTARKGPPRALPVIMFAFLPLFFSLGLGPLLDSGRNPDSNIERITISVASFDGGLVGSSFVSFFEAVGAPGAALPSISIVPASETSPSALQQSVAAGEAVWAAVWVNAGASAALQQALAAPGAAAYIPASAVTLVWNEGRSQVSLPRVGGPLRALLAQFGTAAAAAVAAQLSANATALQAVAAQRPSLLAAPVGFTETVLFPSAQLPLAFTALSIGNIMVAVLSVAVVSVVLGPLTPFFAPLSPVVGSLARLGTALVYSGAIALAYATIVVGLGGAAIAQPGLVWLRLWSTEWLQGFGFCMYLGTCILVTAPPLVGLFLTPLIIFNAIGGWNLDLAGPGYVYFKYTPFYHTSQLERFILFGAFESHVGMNVGVLVAWLALFLGPFLWVSTRKLTAMKAAAAAGASVAGVAGAVKSEQQPSGVEGTDSGLTPCEASAEDGDDARRRAVAPPVAGGGSAHLSGQPGQPGPHSAAHAASGAFTGAGASGSAAVVTVQLCGPSPSQQASAAPLSNADVAHIRMHPSLSSASSAASDAVDITDAAGLDSLSPTAVSMNPVAVPATPTISMV
jgi:hypothetical protein